MFTAHADACIVIKWLFCVTQFIHKLEATNTRVLWNSSNRNVVFGLYDAFKQAQVSKLIVVGGITWRRDLCTRTGAEAILVHRSTEVHAVQE